MKLTKLRVTKEASSRLRFLAGKTGLTPNLLCRIGFCLSLAEAPVPNPQDFPEEEREFNRYTLLGEFDPLFVALLRQRCYQDGIQDPALLPQYFRAHMNRGIMLLQQRTRSISDIVNLVSKTNAA